MAIGQKYSYATIAPIQNDPLGNALQDVEQNAFKYRAEKRLEDEAKAKKEQEALEDYAEWDGKFDPTVVGNSKIDDPMLSMAMRARDRADKIWRELKSPSLSFEQKAKLMSERNKLVQSFDVANQTPKMMIQKIGEIAKNYDKYDQKDLNLLESITKQLETGKYEVNYDDNGTARVKIYKTDEQGKPIGILKETTLADMANEFQPTLKSTYKEDLQKYAKDYEVSKTTTGDYSGTVITDQRVNRNPGSRDYNNAMEYAKVIISKPNERKIIARENKIDQNDEEALLKFITNDILNAIPDEYSNVKDAKLAFDREKEAKKEQKEAINIGDFTVIKESGVVDGDVTLQQNTRSFPLGNVIIDSGQGKKQKATNVYVSPGGKMYLKVEETGFESGSSKAPKLTEQGKVNFNKWKAKNPTLTIDKFPAEFGDIEDVSISDKAPKVKMLDFGKDNNEIGRYALRMGYKGAKQMMNDFIQRAGGDEFITTPDERKQAPKSISKSQLAEKAKASGYSPKEYERLLKERGIKITE